MTEGEIPDGEYGVFAMLVNVQFKDGKPVSMSLRGGVTLDDYTWWPSRDPAGRVIGVDYALPAALMPKEAA